MNAPLFMHGAPVDWPVENDTLLVGGVPLPQLAARVGSTPFYAYDRARLSDRIALLRRHIPREVDLHYAIKANPMPALVSFVAPLVDGLDVASGRELRVALDAGMSPKEISFAGPGKSVTELEQAVASGVLLNAESPREIRELARISERLGKQARVAVRVNPAFELKSSGMKMGGGPKQFGVDAEAVPDMLREIGRLGLGFEGFHIYSGSQNLRADSICDSQRKVFDLAVELSRHAPAPVKTLNVGGGFGVPYFPGDRPLDLAPIGESLHALVAEAAIRLPQVRLVVELGRYIVAEAGVYVCRVIDRKISRGHVFLVTDGGLHHHLAASGNFGQVVRKNYPVAVAHSVRGGQRELASVVGPLCTPLDLLGEKMELGRADEGDFIVVFQSGAYGFTASPHMFLGHPPPFEVFI